MTSPQFYFTSDLHLSHTNMVMRYNRKGHFTSVEAHDEEMIHGINSCAKPSDVLYIIGDVSFANRWRTGEYLDAIKCKNRHLVLGNHDDKLADFYRSSGLFVTVSHYVELHINKQDLILFHYPILQWRDGHYNAWHLHGHAHGGVDYARHDMQNLRILDVGMDSARAKFGYYRPFSYDDVKAHMEGRVALTRDDRAGPSRVVDPEFAEGNHQ